MFNYETNIYTMFLTSKLYITDCQILVFFGTGLGLYIAKSTPAYVRINF